MGILDTASPAVSKGIVTFVLLGMAAIFVAICVTAPVAPVLGDGSDLSALNSGDAAWMLTSTALVLLMTPGVCFFYCGMGDHKNLVSTIMQALLPMAVVPIMWSILGFGIAFGPSPPNSGGILGDASVYALMYNVGAVPNADLAATVPVSLYFLFQLAFAVITPALIIGSVADRVNCSALCIFVALWHIVVYCPLAHMVWHPTGLIHVFGVIDFAGGTVVHMSSGYAALIAAIYLGKSFHQKEHEIFHYQREPANVPYVVLGTTFLWIGWFGFNAGSAVAAGTLASQAFLNSNSAAASAMLTWILMDNLRGHKLRATGACVGAVIGLVAITPAAGYVNVGAAFLIGMIGAMCSSGAQELMERYGKAYLSDTAEVFVCHGIGGTVGMICTSLFATTSVNAAGTDGGFYGHGLHFAKTLAVLALVVPWICIFTYGCLFVTDKIMTLRVSDEELMMGLDVSKHGERAFAINDVLRHHAEQLNGSKHGGSVHSMNASQIHQAQPTGTMTEP